MRIISFIDHSLMSLKKPFNTWVYGKSPVPRQEEILR